MAEKMDLNIESSDDEIKETSANAQNGEEEGRGRVQKKGITTLCRSFLSCPTRTKVGGQREAEVINKDKAKAKEADKDKAKAKKAETNNNTYISS
ncbi:hypothetical protein RF55_17140 [Lasius niger]|uniref:Uncharacterized protein n=1 Tax=Lasius niger TaxID=67767 RepID=A0A0J7K368_LASNI|nr:hypothetical protein RF55_17140 [Lasius niger]